MDTLCYLFLIQYKVFFFFSSRRRHTRSKRDWSSDVCSSDLKEFLGRNGTLAQPAALKRARLSGKAGAGLDPCGAMQVAFDLADGQERVTSFRLGVGRSMAEVHDLIFRFRRADAGRVALSGVHEFWNRTLGAINVDTPDPAVNTIANGWLS